MAPLLAGTGPAERNEVTGMSASDGRQAGGPRTNNAGIFRPEAVQAYVTRRAGDPWEHRVPHEGKLAILLTLCALAGGVMVFQPWG